MIALKNTSEYVIKVVTCLRLNNFASFGRWCMCAADWNMVNERIQYNICTAAQIITLLSDSGKRRGKGCGKLDIVKAYHTYIIWHIEAVQLAL